MQNCDIEVEYISSLPIEELERKEHAFIDTLLRNAIKKERETKAKNEYKKLINNEKEKFHE